GRGAGRATRGGGGARGQRAGRTPPLAGKQPPPPMATAARACPRPNRRTPKRRTPKRRTRRRIPLRCRLPHNCPNRATYRTSAVGRACSIASLVSARPDELRPDELRPDELRPDGRGD